MPQLAVAVTEDQFTNGPVPVTVEPVMICPPTAKTVGDEVFPIEYEEEHYVLYTAPSEAAPRTVFVTNPFATEASWRVTTPKYITVPTAKTFGGVTSTTATA